MPLNIAFESLEETSLRLETTIVLYDGEPVYINQVSNHSDGIARVHLKALPLTTSDHLYRDENDDTRPRRGLATESYAQMDRRVALENAAAAATEAAAETPSIRKVINSPKLDMEPMALGFCNTSKGVHYVSRMPTRKYKQGLCQANMSITFPGGAEKGSKHNFSSLIKETGFAEMLRGVYPTGAEALRALNDVVTLESVAISTDFFLSRHPLGFFFLNSTEAEVGFCLDLKSPIKVAAKYKYLREVLSKIIHNVEFM